MCTKKFVNEATELDLDSVKPGIAGDREDNCLVRGAKSKGGVAAEARDSEPTMVTGGERVQGWLVTGEGEMGPRVEVGWTRMVDNK